MTTNTKYLAAVESQYAAIRACSVPWLKPRLPLAEAYFWDSGPASACWEAARSFPAEWKPSPIVLGPSQNGAWWHLDTLGPSMGLLVYHHEMWPGHPGFVFSVFKVDVAVDFKWDFVWPDDVALGDVAEWWRENSPDHGEGCDGKQLQFISSTARFFAAASVWLSQRILVPADGHIERHRRKQLMREAHTPMPSVKIIELRRELRVRKEPPVSHAVMNFSRRWIVEGHFRNQWHPSTGEHKVRFIFPHIKGPADKPLILPTHTVYAATR